MKNKLIFKLIIAVVAGIVIGMFIPQSLMQFVMSIEHIAGQIILFCVPLIIIGFIAPSITKLKGNASRLLTVAVILAYASSVLAAGFSAVMGYLIIPNLNISNTAEAAKKLPELLFSLDIPAIMPVMSALVLSLMIGLAVAWTKSKKIEAALDEFQNIILSIVNKIVIPILPIFIGGTFAKLAYEGVLTKQLPVFFIVILLVIVGHFIWMTFLYGVAGLYSGKKPSSVFKHYLPAYLTAVGTMSSAATLPVTLTCAKKSDVLRSDVVDFSVPLFSNIHLCGSVLTEVFFVMTVSQILYGKLPDMSSMLVFILLLGIFAIGAPGVPGGTVMASLGLITSVLGFDAAGTALMLTIFALQDSFGTACNVTGDGALTLMLSAYADKKAIKVEE